MRLLNEENTLLRKGPSSEKRKFNSLLLNAIYQFINFKIF